MATNFNQCSYVYKRGKNLGDQCLKNTNEGFCHCCTIKLKINEVRHMYLLNENFRCHNYVMIKKCFDKFIYTSNEIMIYRYNKDIINLWIKSKSQDEYIFKSWLFSHIFLIKDLINVIKHLFYDVNYQILKL